MTVSRSVRIEREWGEVGFGSSKTEGWAWEVAYLESNASGDLIMDRRVYNQLTPNVLNSIQTWVEQGHL